MSAPLKLIGKRFGRLVVLDYLGVKKRRTNWLCRCDCGTEKEFNAGALSQGTSSCGCLFRERLHRLNLAGRRFGRLVVLVRLKSDSRRCYRWLCRCDCGTEKIVGVKNLMNRSTNSCGCLFRELRKRRGDKNPNWKGGQALAYRRRMQNPSNRIEASLRARLVQALRGIGVKSAKTLELLGCTTEFLWAHIEKQFVPGMTWENYGPVWHVDHILPCAEFHLQHSEEQEICFHWTNLQPLFAAENLSKGDRII